MIARKIESQISLPVAVSDRFADVDLFEVVTSDRSIVLRPSGELSADDVRDNLAIHGITEQDIDDAIAWARSHE